MDSLFVSLPNAFALLQFLPIKLAALYLYYLLLEDLDIILLFWDMAVKTTKLLLVSLSDVLQSFC